MTRFLRPSAAICLNSSTSWSTELVFMIVSASDAFSLEKLGAHVLRPLVHGLHEADRDALVLEHLPEIVAAPRPKSLLRTRKSTFFIPSLSTIGAKVAASSEEGRDAEDEGLPEVVDLAGRGGSRPAIGGLVVHQLRHDGERQAGAPGAHHHRGLVAGDQLLGDAAGLRRIALVSSITSSIVLPRTPPLALISSAAILAPVHHVGARGRERVRSKAR